MSELPKGWVLKPLGDYAFVKNGFAFKSKDYISPTNTSMPIIRISDIYGNIASDEKATHVDKSKIQKGFEVHKGDFLIAMSGATTGKTGVYTSHNLAYQNQRVGNIKLISNNLGCDSYKNYSILAVKDKILENAYGAAQPNISGKSLEALLLPIAPLNEQIRIANKLDSLLGKLEATQKHLDKIPTLLKRFRQSVLAAAVSGELTAGWRKQNTSKKWTLKKLTDLVDKIEAGKSIKCIEKPPEKDEYGIIKISAVTWWVYNENESKTLFDKDIFLENRRIKVGDFLISRANTLELLGTPVIVENVTKNLMLSDKVLRLVMDDSEKKWVNIFLRSSEGRKEIENRATGNQHSMRNIGQKSLLDIDLPYPSDLEKSQIIHKVETLFKLADKVEQQYQAAKQRTDKLTQSILAKAFRGELVPQDPHDEPASELLKRIKKSRA